MNENLMNKKKLKVTSVTLSFPVSKYELMIPTQSS